MAGERRGGRARDFLLGGLVGASAAVAAARRRRVLGRGREKAPEQPAGLAAFEDAPCFEEMAEEREADSDS